MTFRTILFTGVGLAAVGILYFLRRNPRKYDADVGAVSADWLAQHRVGPND